MGGDTLRAADIEAGQDSFLAMERDIAYYHHERWDGTGYPPGLMGKGILLAARIVAVDDGYDAVSSKRPYKEAFSHEKAQAIILEGRGTAFDPWSWAPLKDARRRSWRFARGVRTSGACRCS